MSFKEIFQLFLDFDLRSFREGPEQPMCSNIFTTSGTLNSLPPIEIAFP